MRTLREKILDPATDPNLRGSEEFRQCVAALPESLTKEVSGTIAKLMIYPVKSLQGIAQRHVERMNGTVTMGTTGFEKEDGLYRDRMAAVVKALTPEEIEKNGGSFQYRRYSLRECPELLGIEVEDHGDLSFASRAAGAEVVVSVDKHLQSRDGESIPVEILPGEIVVCAIDKDGPLPALISAHLKATRGNVEGIAIALPHKKHFHRPVDIRNRAGLSHSQTLLGDGGYMHWINNASLQMLSAWHGSPIDDRRFRPNVIVKGLPPFAELFGHLWRIRGQTDIIMRDGDWTPRCKTINADPRTRQHDPKVASVFQTVQRHHPYRDGEKPSFGAYGITEIHDENITLTEGDVLKMVEEREGNPYPLFEQD